MTVAALNKQTMKRGNMSAQADKLMTVNDLLDFLQVSRTQVYQMLKQGLPYVSIGHHKRFLAEEVIEWMRNHAALEKTKKP